MKVFWSLRPSPEELLLEPQAEPRRLAKVLQRSISTWLRFVPLNPPCTSSRWSASLGLLLEAAFNCLETESRSKPSSNRNKGVWHGGNKNILFIYTSAMENNMKTCCKFLEFELLLLFFLSINQHHSPNLGVAEKLNWMVGCFTYIWVFFSVVLKLTGSPICLKYNWMGKWEERKT